MSAVSWILQHEKGNHKEWEEAALTANSMDEIEGAQMLKVILQHPHPERPKDFLENLLVDIVKKACLASENLETGSLEFSAVEELTVAKVHAFGDEGIEVPGLKIKSRMYGLHNVTKALEILGMEAKSSH